MFGWVDIRNYITASSSSVLVKYTGSVLSKLPTHFTMQVCIFVLSIAINVNVKVLDDDNDDNNHGDYGDVR